LSAHRPVTSYEEGGTADEKVRRKPFSVVLFDDIRKRRTGHLHSLLQIGGPGASTDAQAGVDFKNTVIIMTTLGHQDISKGLSVGFGTDERVERLLRPDERQGQRGGQAALPAEFLKRRWIDTIAVPPAQPGGDRHAPWI